jgi:uncharacterized membrane protein YfcA
VLKNLYKKIVLALTSFFCGISGAFVLSGAGSPGLNVMFGLIFVLCLLNLSLHANEYYKSFKTRLASFHPPPPPPAKPEGGGGSGGGGGGGSGGGGGKN